MNMRREGVCCREQPRDAKKRGQYLNICKAQFKLICDANRRSQLFFSRIVQTMKFSRMVMMVGSNLEMARK